eukprot:gene32131-16654_t
MEFMSERSCSHHAASTHVLDHATCPRATLRSTPLFRMVTRAPMRPDLSPCAFSPEALTPSPRRRPLLQLHRQREQQRLVAAASGLGTEASGATNGAHGLPNGASYGPNGPPDGVCAVAPECMTDGLKVRLPRSAPQQYEAVITGYSPCMHGGATAVNIDPSIVITKFIAETLLPTRHGRFRLRGYKHSIDGGATFTEPTAIMYEVLGSLKCDCAEQLHLSLQKIQEPGFGPGLEQGLDTVDANRTLGLPDDCREGGNGVEGWEQGLDTVDAKQVDTWPSPLTHGRGSNARATICRIATSAAFDYHDPTIIPARIYEKRIQLGNLNFRRSLPVACGK